MLLRERVFTPFQAWYTLFMKILQSLTNPLVKNIVKLHSRKHRTESQQFIAEGIRTCSALLASSQELITLLVTEAAQEQTPAATPTDRIYLVSDAIMRKISPSSSPSGLLGIFRMPQAPTKSLEPGLVLARVADPGNVGTLIRSAISMGFSTIVAIDSADPWGPKAVQASAGSIGRANIFSFSWQQLLDFPSRPHLCALVAEGGKKPSDISLAQYLLVVGNEARGIPQEWLACCEAKVTMPMVGGVGSLNAAVAGSIALYLARNTC